MKKGIDVSYCQGNINFSKINKNQVQFVIIRSSFGWEANQKDSCFERNYEGFKKLKIPVGAYHYSYAKTVDQAVKEAKYCLECIKGKSFDLPVFIDMEEASQAAVGRRTCTDIAKAFIQTMEKAGYRSGIYTNPNWLENYLYKGEIVGKVNLWLAQWGSSKPYCDCMIWQYDVGKKGAISGINADIDLDYCYADIQSKSTSANKTSTVPVNVLADRDKFLKKAAEYIGKNGYYVCKTKLGLDAILDWCAFAVSAIMKDCGFIGKYTDGVHSFASDEARNGDGKYGTWFLKGTMKVEPGDLIMFRYSGLNPIDKYSASHIGIVEKVDGNTLTTLEGNVEGSGDNWANTSTFKRKTRYLNDSSVYAFFRPKWSSTSTSTSSGSSTSASTTLSTGIPDIYYQVFAGGRWLPYVKNLSDYAGLSGKPIIGMMAKVTKGHIRYRVHLIGGGWLPWVTDLEDFAGSARLTSQIDCVQMELVGLSGYTVKYRVKCAGRAAYLPYVTGWNDKDSNGYAGIYGAAIDRLQAIIVKK